MIQKLKLLILPFVSALLLVAPVTVAGTAHAADVDQNSISGGLRCGSNGDFATNTNCAIPDRTGTVNDLITTVINILSIVVGIIAVIMIIVAGLRYVSSGGKEEGVKNAKNMILYAIIGLIIVALAQIIVHFVLQKTTQVTG